MTEKKQRTPSIDYIDNDADIINNLDFYQKYRPMTFDDVYGQRATVEALRSYVKQFHETGKLPAAIILSGLHGSGKTTLGFILARALNCEHCDDRWNPCNQCDSCKGIMMDSNGAIPGFKYQAMSNLVNGINDVRDLIAQSYNKSSLAKPVYILDEVQALNKSQGAWDCFLNPIESGTPTLFIFCTTEPDKIAKAVRSRCAGFSFGPLSRTDLIDLCSSILKSEDYTIDRDETAVPDAGSKTVTIGQIQSAVDSGNGSARDTLTALSRLASSGINPKASTNARLLRSVFKDCKRGATIKIITDASNNGEDIANAAAVFADSCGRMAAIADGVQPDEGDGKAVRLMATIWPAKVFTRSMTYIGESLANMNWGAGDPRIYFEIALMNTIDLLEKYKAAQAKRASGIN